MTEPGFKPKLPGSTIFAFDHSTMLSQCRSESSSFCSRVGHVLPQKSGVLAQIFPPQADDYGASGCGCSNSSLEEQKSVQWCHQTLRRSWGADFACIELKIKIPPSHGISLRECNQFQIFPDDLLQLSLLEYQITVIPRYPWGVGSRAPLGYQNPQMLESLT